MDVEEEDELLELELVLELVLDSVVSSVAFSVVPTVTPFVMVSGCRAPVEAGRARVVVASVVVLLVVLASVEVDEDGLDVEEEDGLL